MKPSCSSVLPRVETRYPSASTAPVQSACVATWKISIAGSTMPLRRSRGDPGLLPTHRERTPLLVAGRRLEPDDGALMELGQCAGAGIGRAAADSGDDRVDQILDARPSRIEVHARARDALVEEGHPGAFETRRVARPVGDGARRGHAVRLLVRSAVRVALQVAGTLVGAGEPRADHDARRSGGEGE